MSCGPGAWKWPELVQMPSVVLMRCVLQLLPLCILRLLFDGLADLGSEGQQWRALHRGVREHAMSPASGIVETVDMFQTTFVSKAHAARMQVPTCILAEGFAEWRVSRCGYCPGVAIAQRVLAPVHAAYKACTSVM